ncbi:MAG: hypothetical protein M1829_002363 [Trizodia sp. TS-e1964]|nr:MAG: hypothetical protein M1829_002363 [Trizodia sp. TS-e1964]
MARNSSATTVLKARAASTQGTTSMPHANGSILSFFAKSASSSHIAKQQLSAREKAPASSNEEPNKAARSPPGDGKAAALTASAGTLDDPIRLELDISLGDAASLAPGRGRAARAERGVGPRAPLPGDKSLDSLDSVDVLDDFEDEEDEFSLEGEESVGRRWMQEQKDLDMEIDVIEDLEDLEDPNDDPATADNSIDRTATRATIEKACPVCFSDLGGLSDEDTTRHVNRCLDGDPIPLPAKKRVKLSLADPSNENISGPSRFQRPARPPKPGQSNPFALLPTSNGSASAFSKLMTSHAEDAAWVAAASAENQSRGKPAYTRTCPFYKIMPGFSICVDAFRYGAVEGCNGYFLSHFHSDHYIGLTSTWQHGPIYCSRVTANLVKKQLRVDPKWVVDLEFEQKFQVPDTDGVEVTMIDANHCPGSSLFLFEKNMGKGKTPKVQRVLHCGDFRACPAHLKHPLLRPDIIDIVSGKVTGQQKIDVCYLDTTYLNPRYAFPSQEDVIEACAAMCVSLSNERIDENDAWEKMKKDRAGGGMTKFISKDSTTQEEDGHTIKRPSISKPVNTRGRLLVVVGTYSIGKERVCLGIARALKSKIFAPANKRRICACLEDPELDSLITTKASEAQVHMTPLTEIRPETLADYLTTHREHFSRVVGFRPSGWSYTPPKGRFLESPAVATVLNGENWRSRYSMANLTPQRGSTRTASCFGVPYSEHSSFRELTVFCCALRIERIVPTVNVGSAKSRELMKMWIDKWAAERKKNGLFTGEW